MQRSILTIVGIVLVMLLGIGAFIYWNTRSPAPVKNNDTPSVVYPGSTVTVTNDKSKEAVQAAYRAEDAKHPGDNIKLYETVIVEEYALQVWVGDTTGGQALLKYSSSSRSWELLDGGGGRWSVETLVNVMGVPQNIAEKLLAGL